MKKIAIFAPFPAQNDLQSGISIRIEEVCKWFKDKGFRVIKKDHVDNKLITNVDFLYILISTKSSSLSYQVSNSLFSNNKKIIDLYTPIFLEKKITFSKFNPYDWLNRWQSLHIAKNILKSGNHFLVANHRQKKYWLDATKSFGVNLATCNISVLPTGTPKILVVKSQVANVILWFGGIYPWLTPKSLIEAFSKISAFNKSWKLRIVGGFFPSTGYQKIYMEVIKRAKSLIPPSQLEIVRWQNLKNLKHFLRDVAFAVHLVKKTDEDYYAHRVRLLTLLDAGIPILTNGDDIISKFLIQLHAGLMVSNNQRSLVEKLRFVMSSPSLLDKWSKNAGKIEKVFLRSEEDMSDLLKLIYPEKYQ